jgi:putative transposase
VLDVSCSGFYAWRFRPPSARAVRHAWLTDMIREVHTMSYGTYGAKRVYAELVLGRGIQIGHNAVPMLMQRAGIAGRNGARKRYERMISSTGCSSASGRTNCGSPTSPSIRPVRERSTAPLCSTRSAVARSVGRSATTRRRH